MSKTKAEIGGRLVGLVQSQTLSHSFLSLLPGGQFFFFFFFRGVRVASCDPSSILYDNRKNQGDHSETQHLIWNMNSKGNFQMTVSHFWGALRDQSAEV